MSNITRNPSGQVENASILTLFGFVGNYAAKQVNDPDLFGLIIMGTMILGNVSAQIIRNKLGGPMAEVLLGAKPSKGVLIKDLK